MVDPSPRSPQPEDVDRAEEAFVAFLEQSTSLGGAPFEVWLAGQPTDLQPLLRRIHVGHEQAERALAGLGPWEDVLGGTSSARGRRFNGRLAIAAALVVLVPFAAFWTVVCSPRPDTSGVASLAYHLSQQLAKGESMVKAAQRRSPRERDLDAERRQLEFLATVAGELQRIRPDLPLIQSRHTELTESLRAVNAIRGEVQEVDKSDAGPGDRSKQEFLRLSLPLAMMLEVSMRDVEAQRLRERLVDSPAIQALLDWQQDRIHLNLKVVDREADDRMVEDADVYATRVDCATGRLGETHYLGASGDVLNLGMGDWRITVQDARTRRHAELNVIALPGDLEKTLVAFLNNPATVTSDLLRVPAGRFRYGGRDTWMHYPPESERVGAFWISPYEATLRDYADFYDFAHGHPELFEGWSPKEYHQLDECAHTDWASHPVHGLDWYEAVQFMAYLGLRLPTDREWEYVAKGSENRRFPWGNDPDETGRVAATEDFGPGAVDDFLDGAVQLEDGAVFRMGDNALEWVSNIFASRTNLGQASYGKDEESYQRVIRGGGGGMNVDPDADVRGSRIPGRTSNVRIWRSGVGVRGARSDYPGFRPDAQPD